MVLISPIVADFYNDRILKFTEKTPQDVLDERQRYRELEIEKWNREKSRPKPTATSATAPSQAFPS